MFSHKKGTKESKQRAASRESNLKIEFKLCGKAAREKRHVFEINLVSWLCLLFFDLHKSPTINGSKKVKREKKIVDFARQKRKDDEKQRQKTILPTILTSTRRND
jgi:hypothetical protein